MTYQKKKTKLLRRWAALFTLAALLTLMPVSALYAARGDHQFSMGPEVSHIKYEEPDVMEETGVMIGVVARYVYRPQGEAPVESIKDLPGGYSVNQMWALEGKFAYASMDYDSNATGSIDNIDDYLGEIRILAGYDVPLKRVTFTPFTGFGWRYLNDQLGGKVSTTGHFGYDRETYYYYMPFGFELAAVLKSGWRWLSSVEYDLFLSGTQKSHLEDVSPALNTLENDQDSGFGVRGKIELAKEGERFDVSFGPYLRYWNIDESDTATITCGGTPCAAGYEPKNRSLEVGGSVSVRF